MQTLNNKVTNGQLTADEWNEAPSELQNAITRSGQTLSGADLEQLAKAIVDTAASASFYVDTGVANAYVVGAIGGKLGLSQLALAVDGATVRFRPANANTGASTINVAGLGVKDIRRQDGSAVAAGNILTSTDLELRYDQANDRWLTAAPPVGVVASGSVASFVSVPIPADIIDITNNTEVAFDWDYSARNESEDWFGGLTTDQSLFTVPAGINRVTIDLYVGWANQAVADINFFRIRCFLEGSATGFGPHFATTGDYMHAPTGADFVHHSNYPFLEVSPGEEIDIRYLQNTGVNTQDILAAGTYVNIFGFNS